MQEAKAMPAGGEANFWGAGTGWVGSLSDLLDGRFGQGRADAVTDSPQNCYSNTGPLFASQTVVAMALNLETRQTSY
jgi:hypothetical protein